MGRYAVRVLATVALIGLGAIGAANSPPVQAKGGTSGASVTVVQKLINFRLQDAVSVSGSGFPANSSVSVTLTTSTNGSVSDISTNSAQTDGRGNFSTSTLKTVNCPQGSSVSYQATASSTTSAQTRSAC